MATIRQRQRVRMFALIWTVLTLILGVATFVAIYMIYGIVNSPRNAITDSGNLALPIATLPQPTALIAAAVNTATATNPPTEIPASPTAQALVQAATEADPTEIPPSPTPLPVNDRVFRAGTQVQVSPDMNPDNQEAWMRDVRDKLHMQWFKQQVRWEDVEPAQGEYNWTALDLALPLASEYGLKVMLSIVTAPGWARESGVNLEQHGPPANPQVYADFVGAILERYPHMVHAVEVWNEQNLDREWTSSRGLSAANYVELLRVTTQSVKAIDPGVIIISGALAPTGGWTEGGVQTAIDDFNYLDSLINAGLLNYADCVGAHHNGYNIGPSQPWDSVANDPAASFRGPFDNKHHSWSFYSTLQTYANKIQLAGGDQPLCITEFGWASTEDLGGFPPGFEFANDNTLAEQAEWTVEALDNMEEWGTVWLAFIWNYNYGPQAGWDTNNDNVPYSMIGKDWVFRPVFDEVSAWQQAYNERTGAG